MELNAKNNSNIAYIISALRDGCFTQQNSNYIYRIRVYQKNKIWINRLSNILESTFDKTPRITFDKRKGIWCLEINSKTIFKEIVKLSEYPGSQKEWKTPSWILKSSNEIIKSYIKGFFDAEGGIPHIEEREIAPKDIRIHFSQGNKQSLSELKSLIERFNIKTGKVCGPYYKKGYSNPQYVLMIHGIKEMIKFYNLIGSLHPLKIKRFEIIKQAK
ncbi:LAGLIDADG family homing endonuclease [Candidatus Woesearchaeota archaeon]|nr:LAGLIDADG family homing endonuclease [Candidatus Woesearchaeota archaeon]